ncbi:MAG TPA: uroporphyrinogen-III C-methyltransferase [Vicinamibacterales bacterium]|jgi:uroporphyrinogen III methyltransferase/synthase|nr:uroporphyrinogen-III C-methyltransferase [Vicinamibacterales bacterium]
MSIVYLIGAGPGDPGLITVRGLQYLAAADVVLYDHLVPARLLRAARADAEQIDVGTAALQPLEQEAICYLLAEKAREGKTVARLKWGDPFVFDSGGSEALFLHEQGVRFEVVPGIPAGIAVPGYAGIPITYPGGGDTVTFIRGHEDEGKTPLSIDWTSLARLDGTLVCYAGPQQLPEMLSALLAHGRPSEDSAAVVYDGTLPTQQTIAGTLREVADAVEQGTDPRPATLVVGRVVALREHLRWFDARPLSGKRILVTRPKDQSMEFVDRLEAMGAEAIEAPMIRILPPEDYGPLDEACARAGDFDWIVFSSVNAVDAFMSRLLAGPLDVRALGGVRLCGVGPATAERLAGHGLKVDLTPPEYRAEAILRVLSENGEVRGQKVLLPHADIGRELVADELRKQGAEVTEVVAYRTVAVEADREGEPDVYRMLLERSIDVVTFTSASAVRNFVRVLGAEPAADLLASTVVACIGPVTAEAASQFKVKTAIQPSSYTIPALVGAIAKYFEGRGAEKTASSQR